MAKRIPPTSNDGEIKKLLEGLYKIVQTTNASSKEQIRINRELLKTMAVLQSGFAKNEDEARRLIDDVRDGLELNDEYAKKWLKKMGATDKQIEEIVDKFRDLEKIDLDLIDNAEDYLDLLERRYDVLDDTFDLTKRLLTNHDAITKAIKASKDVAMKLAGPMGDVDAILQKMIAKKVDVSSMFDGVDSGVGRINDTIEMIKDDISGLINNVGGSVIDLDLHFSPLTDDLDKEIKSVLESIEIEKRARLDGLQQYFDVNTKLQNQLSRSLAAQMSGIDITFDVDTGQITTATGILEKGSDEYQAMIQKLDQIASDNQITDKLKVDFKKIVELIGLGTDRLDDQDAELQSILGSMDLATRMMVEQLDLHNALAQKSTTELMIAKDRYKVMGTYLNQLQTAESIVLKIGAGFDNLNAIMPTGIGEFLGLSKVSAALIESHKKGVQAFADELDKGVSHADALKSYYQELTPALTSALNPMTILVTSTILLFKFVSNITDKYKEISSQLRVSLGQSKKLYDTQLDILTSQKNQFATIEDISEAQAAMIGTSGKVFDLMDASSKQLTISLIESGKAFGYGTEKAVQLHKVFKSIGADDSLADNLQMNLGLLSEAAGLSPQIVTDDLIDSAEEVSTYFAGMPIEAAKAAIKVRQLGMSLKQAGQIAQKMLNLEGFMTDMYELQAMTGGGIDFSSAFDKGLMGDIEGMTEDIMNNIGTTAEFNRMDYLTRMKIASTLGMSVDELAKSVKLREDMAGMSEKDQAYMKANLDRMGDISTASKEEIRNRMQQLQSTDRLNVAWEKIKGTLIKALLPAVEIIADAISAIAPLLDGIVGIVKIFGSVLKIVFPIVQGLLFPFKMIGMVIEQIVSFTDSFAGSLSGVDSILSGIGKATYVIGAAIGTVFAIRNIGTFFSFITGGFGSMVKSVLSIVPAITGTIGTLFSTLTGIPTKLTSVATASNQTATESAERSIKNTKDVAQSAIQEMNGVAGSASDSMQTAAASAAKSVSTTSSSIDLDPVKNASQTTISEVEKASKQSIDTVKSAANDAGAVVETVKSKTKKGFFSSDKSKSVFKAIGAIGATTFATLATKAAMSFFQAGEEGKESMHASMESAMPLMGSALAGLGPLLFESLSGGVEKFVRKQLEGKLEKKFEPVLKKVRKGFESIGGSTEDIVEKVSSKGSEVVEKVTDKLTGKSDKIVDEAPVPSESIDKTAKSSQPEHQESIDKKSKKSKVPMDNSMEKSAQEKSRSITKTFQSIGDAIKSTWESVKASITDIIKFGIDTVKQLATGLVDVTKILINGFQSVSGTLFNILKSASKTLKSILTDMVDFVGKSMKTLSSGIGASIKNILTGIGNGLSSFKASALTGAAALVVLSGALWISSKAIQNFAKTDWESVVKAGAVLGGLVVAGLALGSASPAMLIGAAALAAMGGALLLTGAALEKFVGIEWSDLGKAGAALVGLGVAAVAFGAMAPIILVGASAMALGSVAIMAFGASIGILSESVSSIDPSPLVDLTNTLVGMSAVSITQIMGISGAIVSLGASLLAFSMMNIGGGMLTSISSLFSNDLLKDLERFALLANPLQIAANAIESLGASLSELSNVMNSVDLDKLDELSKIGKISVEQKMTNELMGKVSSVQDRPMAAPDIQVVPVPTPAPVPQTPRKESVAQNVKIVDSKQSMIPEVGVKAVQATPMVSTTEGQKQNNTDTNDIYNRPDLPLKELKFLLQDAVKWLELIARKESSINLDSYKISKTMKAQANNK